MIFYYKRDFFAYNEKIELSCLGNEIYNVVTTRQRIISHEDTY